jgi:PAS domain S-box-containing protein
MNSLKTLLKPPVFEDETKTQQAYMLHIILWTLVLVPIPFAIYTLAIAHENTARSIVQIAFGESVNIFLLILLRRGFVRLASVLQVSLFWIFFTITAFTDMGVQGEAYLLGYGLVIAIAGFLLGGTGALFFTVLSLLSGAAMVYVQMQGWLGIGAHHDPAITTWIISLVLFPVGALLQYLSSGAQRRALERARASEEKYRLISSVSADYTFSTELDAMGDMHLNWVAGAFESITGFTYEEYVASGGWRAHLYPADVEADNRAMRSLQFNRKAISEVRTFNKNWETRWARVYSHPVWDEKQDRLVGIVGAVQDITAQKQAEEALRTSEEIYRQAIEVYGAVPYHQTYVDNRVIYDFVGEGIKQLTGYTAEEFDENLWDSLEVDRVLLDGLAEYAWDEAVQRVRRGDDPIWRCEHCIRHRDGRIRWILEAAVELRDEHGISHGSVGMFQDITEQKLIEEHTELRQTMLEKVIRLGKNIAEVSDLWTTLDRVWHGVHDDLGFDRLAIFLYNRERNSMDSTLGTDTHGEMVRTWGIWFPAGEGTIFHTVLSKPNGLYFTHNYDVENNIPPGNEMYGVKDFAAVAAWAGDKPVAVVCADNVVTGGNIGIEQLEALRLYCGYVGLAIENARLNESLQNELDHGKSMIEELEAKNAELERFTYTVSHDLKSPLVTITGFLGYLEMDAVRGNIDKVKMDILRISNAARKMEYLLNDLLELSRVGRLMNPPENIPFEDILREALEQVRGRMEAGQVRVVIQPDLPIVHGDRVRLVEVVQNLLENAAKYTSGCPDPQVEIGTRGENEQHYPILFVRDNGIGVDPQYHERIFGLFNKLNPQIEGTGIGLTLVKRIIEVHGGRIWIESSRGSGATFFFTLPPLKI